MEKVQHFFGSNCLLQRLFQTGHSFDLVTDLLKVNLDYKQQAQDSNVVPYWASVDLS
jgi:hypothetical protein